MSGPAAQAGTGGRGRPDRRSVVAGAVGGVAGLLAGCSGSSDAPTPSASAPGPTTSTPGLVPRPVTPDDGAVFPNPDRGITVAQESHADTPGLRAFWPLSDTSWGAVRARGDTIVFRMLYAERHLDGSPFTSEWLDAVRADLVHARENGLRVLPRLAYRPGQDPVHRGSPYHDSPPVDAVLRHLDQLVPVLEAESDALLAVEQGSYGLWGEGCYTDHFATAYDERLVSPQNWEDRFRVLDHLLAGTAGSATPVLVRYPALVERYAAGRPTSPHLARIGVHDDAIDADADDLGTFRLFESRSVDASRAAVREIAARVPFGGECAGHRARSTTAAAILDRLRGDRTTFLLGSELPPAWTAQQQLLRRVLGYRLVARAVRVGDRPRPSGRVLVEVDVENVGCAPPLRARSMRLQLVHGARTLTAPDAGTDVRGLAPGRVVTLRSTFSLPADVPPADWVVSVHAPDPSPRLAGRPAFALRLANRGAWDDGSGRNRLVSLAGE